MCNVLHAAGRSAMPGVVSYAQQQQSESPPAVPDSNQPGVSAEPAVSLSDQVVRDVLEPLRVGMETQNLQLVLSIFDKKELNGYSDLAGQLRAFFQQYDEVRFRYQILQATADKDRGSATSELEMDALPYEPTQVPSRRSVQMRFQLKLETKGWKVVAFTPPDFFALGFNRAGAQ